MAEDLPDILKTDPLGELARKARKALLGTGIVALAMSKGGLVPSKITAFGIEISQIERRAILMLVALVVLYFLFSFLMYAIPDLMAWWVRYKRYQFELETGYEQARIQEYEDPGSTIGRIEPPPSQQYRASEKAYWESINKFRRIVFAKVGLNLAIPCLVGLVSLFFVFGAMLQE